MTDKIKFLRVKHARIAAKTGIFCERREILTAEGGGRVTKQQKKDVRKALRRYGMERAEEKNTAAEWVRAWAR